MSDGWGAADVVAAQATHGYTDAGEEAAFLEVAAQSRGRVLDIGVGAGRTTGLLVAGAAEYVGVDIAPEMLARARALFPDADLRQADARSLAGLADGSFDLVLFSHNGLDALDHAGRLEALAAMARVTSAGGRVLFSSLNLDGVSFDERPWSLRGIRDGRALRTLVTAARHPAVWTASVGAYRRGRRRAEDGPGWATRPLRAHDFRFVVHFSTLAATVDMARAAGLEPVSAFTEAGAAVDLSAPTCAADYVHFVCRPTAAVPGP